MGNCDDQAEQMFFLLSDFYCAFDYFKVSTTDTEMSRQQLLKIGLVAICMSSYNGNVLQ